MKTAIQDTKLYKDFIKALDIHDMRSDDNPFVIKCCKIAEEYASTLLQPKPEIKNPSDNDIRNAAFEFSEEYYGGYCHEVAQIAYTKGAIEMRDNKIFISPIPIKP